MRVDKSTYTLPTQQYIRLIVGLNDGHNGALRGTPQPFQANIGIMS
jgi:hypothetical protein